MRDYSKVSPKFWTGKTGKALRKHPEAQIVAIYLMTCPTSEMTGVFNCPLMYIAHETGLGEEGALKGLARLYELDFCTFEEETDTFFVHEMATYQIGEELKVSDNQVKSVKKAFSAMKGIIRARFFEKYKVAFHLVDTSPSGAPSKPRAGTGAGTEAEAGTDSVPDGTGGKPPKVTDPDEIIFGYGVPLLISAGSTEKAARSFLGGLRKVHGDAAVVDKLRECFHAKPLQPLTWLAAALPPDAPAGGQKRRSGPQVENFDAVDYGLSGVLP